MIALLIILAVIALILLIPIRLYAEYNGAVSVRLKILLWNIWLYPRKKRKPKPEKSQSVKPGVPAEAPRPSAQPAPKPEVSEKREAPPKPEAEKTKPPKAETPPPPEAAPEAHEKEKFFFDKLSGYLELAEEFLGPLRRAVRRLIKAESITADITVGTGEAPSTAVTTGMLWSVGYGLISIIDRIFKVESHKLQISPYYEKAAFKAEAGCILRTNPANIIGAAAILGIAYLKHILKNRRNKNERASVK